MPSATDSSHEFSNPPFPSEPSSAHGLATLVRLLASISGDGGRFSARSTLVTLREATAAEFAELYLWDSLSQDMLLTEYVGPFRTAFWQRLRFRSGEGFPGLVAKQREPVVSDRLTDDRRFLRTRVKAHDFSSCCCLPLSAAGQLVGAVCVGSRNHDFDLKAAVRLITWVSAPIAAAIQADMLMVRDEVADKAWDVSVDTSSVASALEPLIASLCDVLEADGGKLILQVNGQPVASPVSVGISDDAGCWLWEGDGGLPCPALTEPRSVGLFGSRRSWDPACRRIDKATPIVLCTPVRTGKDIVGLFQVFYERKESKPPTHRLPLLQAAASSIAPRVRWIRDRELLQMESGARLWRQRQSEMNSVLPSGAKASAEPYLRIRCFGAFEIYRDGVFVAPREWKRRKSLLLLKMLVLRANRPVVQDVLIEQLWPGIDPAIGTNRLYVLIHALRKMIEPPSCDGDPVVILTDGDSYLFSSDSFCWLDLQEFQDAIDLGTGARRRGDTQEATVAFQHASTLYRGDIFEDEPFAEWCWLDREYLRENYLTVMRNLASLHIDGGKPEEAIACYREVLRADPLREEVHRKLLDVLRLLNRNAEALREHDLFRQRLADELSVPPLPETRELVEKIRAQNLANRR